MDLHTTLQRLHDILRHHPGDGAAWIASAMELGKRDETACYRLLNSKRIWGGAGSIASHALADNPGMDERLWQADIRELRELMIELGRRLQERGNEYPDISTWLSAFSHWNQSGV